MFKYDMYNAFALGVEGFGSGRCGRRLSPQKGQAEMRSGRDELQPGGRLSPPDLIRCHSFQFNCRFDVVGLVLLI